jgi:hypothetical protein
MFLTVRGAVSYPYKSTEKITGLYTLMFIYWGANRKTKDSAYIDSKHFLLLIAS